MTRRYLLLPLLVCVLTPWAAVAQSSAATTDAAAAPTAPASAPVLPDYRLGADDVLNVTVLSHPECSVPAVEVLSDGKITLPLLKDPIMVKDMTVQELTTKLTEMYRKYLVNPFVTVTVTHKRQVLVSLVGYAGAVTMEYHPNMRISELLAPRSSSAQTADFSKVTVTRKDGSKQMVDMTNMDQKAGTDADIYLRESDTVYVPRRLVQFSVLGEVEKPGTYDFLHDGMTILEAITAAGNPKETADLNGATITENGKEEKLDLYAMLRTGDLSGNRPIVPGASIMVPEIHNRTYVFGEVSKPGYYAFKPGDRVLDALNVATPLQTADLRRVNRIHIDKTKNVAIVERINVAKIFTGGDMKSNVALAAGDVLYIPTKRKSFGFADVLGALTSLNVVNSTAGILTHGLGQYRY